MCKLEEELLTEEAKDEMKWALDNIPPWDDFWLSVPSSVVIQLTGIKVGPNPTLGGSSSNSYKKSRNKKRKEKLQKRVEEANRQKKTKVRFNNTLRVWKLEEEKDELSFDSIQELKRYFHRYGIFNEAQFGKYKGRQWATIRQSYYDSALNVAIRDQGKCCDENYLQTKQTAEIGLVVGEYRKHLNLLLQEQKSE